MRIVGVPTKTLSELEALFIYRFCKGLDNRTKYISSLYKPKRRILLGLFNEKSPKAPEALVFYIRNNRKSRDRGLGDYVGLQKELRKSIATHDGSNLDSASILKLPVHHCMYIKQLVQL